MHLIIKHRKHDKAQKIGLKAEEKEKVNDDYGKLLQERRKKIFIILQ
jgi:hypothetical protein